ncbi:MAG: hypothetical protein JW811_06680 [Clostridiales bacterium]|nr:hypothetical protein [Clostridiales bacterium]
MYKKLTVLLLCVALTLGLAGGIAYAADGSAPSIDFEDGLYGFVGLDMSAGNADASVLSVVDYLGSKALKVEVQKKVPYVIFEISALLGDDVAKLASVTMDIGIDNGADDKFYACSGRIYKYFGEENEKTYDEWSVYLASRNPNAAKMAMDDDEAFIAGAGNYIVLSKEVDNYATKTGDTPVSMYIDNVCFYDAEGNMLAVDTSAMFVPRETGTDLSNLCWLTGATAFEGFAKSAGAWSQDGLEMPQEIIDALVPGSGVQIEFSSESGDMWIVMPDSAAGWMRVGGCGNGNSYINNAKSIAQIPYELIAKFCGEDKSTWGARMQCEASGAWEVYSVSVGKLVPQITLSNTVEFEGFQKSAGAWSQDGLEMPQAIIDALVPGSVVEISYASETGDMWIVMPDSAAGWMRVGNDGSAICVDGKCYITYEMIEALCGADTSTWGARMQCEASGAWEVYSVRVGTKGEMAPLSNLVSFAGFETSAGAWSQDGLEMPQEIIDALVPGSVVTINFASEDGTMWIVMPDSAAGWMRVGGCGNGNAAVKDGISQIPYELIEQYCGADKTTWGARMQCEASSAWEVYSVAVGTAAE